MANLLTNYDFETGALTPWSGVNMNTAEVVSSTSHGGTYALHVVGNSDATIKRVRQSIASPSSYGGLTLTLSAWVKVTTGGANVKIAIEDNIDRTESSGYGGGGSWELMTVTRTITASPTVLYANLCWVGAGTAIEAYADDVSLSQSYGTATVTTQATSAITATTATGNGNVTGLGSPTATQYGHVWSKQPIVTTGAYTTQPYYLEKGAPSATGAYTSSLTNLIPNTTYYTCAYIKNTIGTAYGAPDIFTTSSSTATVSTGYVTNTSSSTAIANGTLDSIGGNAVTEHGHCWSTSANPTTADSKTTLGSGSVGSIYSLMANLTAGTTYHTRGYATNSSGTSYGSDVTFVTLSIGTPIVQTDTPTNVLSTGATANGTISDIGSSNITQHGFCWDTTINPTTNSSSSGNWGKSTLGAGGVGTFSFIIINLPAGTKIFIRAYATNTQGTAYGNNESVNATTWTDLGRLLIIGEHLVYISKTGTQRAILGEEF